MASDAQKATYRKFLERGNPYENNSRKIVVKNANIAIIATTTFFCF